MEQVYGSVLSVLAAIGLAAACGFRVFVPLLALSLAARAGLLELQAPFAWIGSDVALTCLAVATVLEIAGYYIPVVDNLLDAVATPAAVVAGIVVAAAVITDVDPWLRWVLATVAGGGAAAAVQIPTVVTRGLSTGASAGVGNPMVSTGEMAAASVFSALAILWPLMVAVAALAAVALAWGLIHRRERRRARLQAPAH